MKRAVTMLMSGGIDSTACAHFLKKSGHEVHGMFIDYGQNAAAAEKLSAIALSQRMSVPVDCISVRGSITFGAGEILGRNALLVLCALCFRPLRSGLIALGIHSGTRYYDCSPAFHRLIDKLVAEYTDGRVRAAAPFLHWSKREVYEYFEKTGLPVEESYSCEAGTVPPCGECLSCQDRKALTRLT